MEENFLDAIAADGFPEIFKVLLDHVHDGVYFTDTSRRILYWNKGAEAITGYRAEEVIGRSCHENLLVHVDGSGTQLCMAVCPLAHTIRDGKFREARVFLKHRNGHRVPVLVRTAQIRDPQGRVIGGLETFRDISGEIAAFQTIETLQEMALLDPLTGIGNRRYCDNMLRVRLEEMSRLDVTGGVVFLDIDYFKAVNDTYGHQLGDLVLKMVARTLAGALRKVDFIGRWGGEEFLVLCQPATMESLRVLTTRLLSLVRCSSLLTGGTEIRVTLSAGCALMRTEDTPATVMERVDRLLYMAKNTGRDCFFIEEGEKAVQGRPSLA
ncbi:MAG TPA: sensor domain-containing diguanylate cyclase [Candidatus Hydrogenedentes bacterium]|nr:sensor domain-containing diguanylate cyclase [Candidatus Hydrogenedentota bacterium]